MRPSQVLAATLAFSSLSAAWIDPVFDGKAVGAVEGMLYARADPPSSTPSVTGKPTDSSKNTATGASNSPSPTGSGKSNASGSGATKTTDKQHTTVFDPRLPPGGISMITPGVFSGPQYYKIGEWVTFGWNYTSLSVTPTAIDILATCTKNQATYTLATNQTVNATGLVLWDTGAYQSTATVPLLTETYTLIIYDADSSISAAASAGYLSVYNQFTFGMYTPQPYVDRQDFKCPSCNSGSSLSAHEKQTLAVIFAAGTITVLSFTWSAASFGLF